MKNAGKASHCFLNKIIPTNVSSNVAFGVLLCRRATQSNTETVKIDKNLPVQIPEWGIYAGSPSWSSEDFPDQTLDDPVNISNKKQQS